jgi:hypothetical protein
LPGPLNHFAGGFLRVARNATESAVCGESDFLDLRFGTDFFFVFAMLKSWHTAIGKEIKIQTGVVVQFDRQEPKTNLRPTRFSPVFLALCSFKTS